MSQPLTFVLRIVRICPMCTKGLGAAADARRDVGKSGLQGCAQGGDGADDNSGDQGDQETVFHRSGAFFVTDEIGDGAQHDVSPVIEKFLVSELAFDCS